ncbi:MAG: hypothetical protein PHW00_03225 [Clostridia bacterium]|nr:hypothetical protein [Clostridia bacterium]
MNQNLYVEREPYEAKGKTYFSHYIKGNIRGTDVKILLAPPDNGGYTVLDIVYNGENTADFIVKPFEMKNDAGETIKGNTYSVQSIDKETGEIYECAVKPLRNSDKNLLKMLLK